MFARSLAACGLALLLAGCLPESVNPLTPPEQALEAPELLGLWRSEVDDAVLFIHVLRGDGNQLEVVAVGHEADGSGSTDLYIGHVAQIGTRRYVSLQTVDVRPDDSPSYWIVAYEPGDDDGVTLLFLSADTLAQAVTDGRLTGEVSQDSLGQSVRLTGSGQEIAAFLAETDAKELFDQALDLVPVPVTPAAP
jgi:hypothetical protein